MSSGARRTRRAATARAERGLQRVTPGARCLRERHLVTSWKPYCVTISSYIGHQNVRDTMSDETTNANTTSNRAIVSVLGADRSGIVAAVAGLLAERNVNILDISQTILQGLFTMTTLVDLGDADFAEIHVGLDELAKQLGVQITIQREDVFKFMYRL